VSCKTKFEVSHAQWAYSATEIGSDCNVQVSQGMAKNEV